MEKIDFDNSIFADLHIHSKYSRATSINLSFENLVKWAKIKGLNLLGTGDFTHPKWFEEIKQLKDNGKGIYYYHDTKNSENFGATESNSVPNHRNQQDSVGFPFIITGEISLIYTQDRGRRIHLVILVPDIETAEKINAYLDTKGRRDYDGRPIFKISGEQFVKDMMNISKDIEVICAHCMTPWFGIFGSMSGFDSLKECFKEQFENVHAVESGMSADPEMLWRIKELENKSIVSFSDSHSFWPFRLGREATIFKKTDSYNELIRQIRENDFVGTIETEPAYGKYHYDGHRLCNFSCSPEESKKINGICPVCKKPLVIGVDNRVEQIANFPRNYKSKNAKPFFKLLPLHELIALNLNSKLEGKKTWEIYNSLIPNTKKSEIFGATESNSVPTHRNQQDSVGFENEFYILLKASKEELIKENIDDKLIELILTNREGKIKVKPGYDGVYGIPLIEEKQQTLF